MQFKALLLSALVAGSSAAVVERQAEPTDLGDILNNLPSGVDLGDLIASVPTEAFPSEVQQFIPLLTAIPDSVLTEILQAAPTLRPEDAEAFYSSIVDQLPTELAASLTEAANSLSGEIDDLTTGLSISAPTTAATNTAVPTDSPSETDSEEEPSETESETSATETEDAPTASGTPNAGSRSYVGASILGVTGIMGLVFAL